MIKTTEKKTNNNVDILNLQDNHLSIQLSLDGFSFCIYNKIQNEIGALAVFEFDEGVISPIKHLTFIKELFKQESLLQNNYETVSVVHSNNLVTQVPKPFFNKENLVDYLQNTVKVLKDDFITFDEIQNTEIVNVYIPFVNINNFLLDKFGSFVFKHSSTVLIENLLNQYKNSEEDLCFINVAKKSFEIVIIQNNKLQLYNLFNFNTKEDFIYYILFSAEQLNLNPEDLKLTFLGEIEKESELYKIAYQYIRNIDFYSTVNYPQIIENLAVHSNFTLLNQLS